ncbi:MAG: KilA-N domain-containing protein [Candidatus Nomurabacteria bacterium]|jgi:hypothetical protein|nr:KilA-N domain-containing protein [Candidatus Nomurabacteria bacterium]
MFDKKNRQLKVDDNQISLKRIKGEDYISLTDMVKNLDGDDHIKNWMRNRNTIEFLGTWETMNNPKFKGVEFDTFMYEAGANKFTMTPAKWVNATGATGIISIPGRNGGTYAHKDIAFEFGTWISPAFKLYLIKDYQRLKEIESNKYNLEWDVRRIIASSTYTVHTDAVKQHLISSTLPWAKSYKYASEADIINLALFGTTAKEWRENHPDRAKAGENIRDSASITELLVLENMQVESANLISKKIPPEDRFNRLLEMANRQKEALNRVDPVKGLKKLDSETYLDSGS